jgi:hypothetical protein
MNERTNQRPRNRLHDAHDRGRLWARLRTPAGRKELEDLEKRITQEAAATGLPGRENGPQDVHRHCLLAGEPRLRFGTDGANDVLNANELRGIWRGLSRHADLGNLAAQTANDKLVNDRCLAAMKPARTEEDVRRIAREKTLEAIRYGGDGRRGSLPYGARETWVGGQSFPEEWGGARSEGPHPGYAPFAVDRIIRRLNGGGRGSGGNGGPVDVAAYTRADGTQVPAHTRSAPGR